MASLEDLIATINGGMHAGQQGSDLKDLYAKLAQTLHPTLPPYRPIPPQTTNLPQASGPMPPPAPASSWNSPPVATPQNLFNTANGHGHGSPLNTGRGGGGGNSWGGMGNSPRQGGNGGAMFVGQRETGFNVGPSISNGKGHGAGSINGNNDPGTVNGERNTNANANANTTTGQPIVNADAFSSVPPPSNSMPYHAAVLPVRASPKDTGGFSDDAFKPLWNGGEKNDWSGFGSR